MNFKRSLGQHLLRDRKALTIILEALPPSPKRIVEIGPGTGSLTLPLLERGHTVIGIEIDPKMVAYLRDKGVEALQADARKSDWIESLPAGEWGVIGNLPYYASTRILRNLGMSSLRFPWLLLMFQKEVAERILGAGTRKGGPLGVWIQALYEVKKVLDLSPGAFFPPPRVTSTVLLFHRRSPSPPLQEEEKEPFWQFLLGAFSRRRGFLIHALTRSYPGSHPHWIGLLEKLGLPRTIRAEEIPPETFLLLFRNKPYGEFS
jgi:16S rRNA (adenine1518-N6/adenine1519-N6)-dimethyltransferase